jgi:hypothetical protein
VDIDRPGAAEEVIVPDLRQQLRPGKHSPGVLREVLEQFGTPYRSDPTGASTAHSCQHQRSSPKSHHDTRHTLTSPRRTSAP